MCYTPIDNKTNDEPSTRLACAVDVPLKTEVSFNDFRAYSLASHVSSAEQGLDCEKLSQKNTCRSTLVKWRPFSWSTTRLRYHFAIWTRYVGVESARNNSGFVLQLIDIMDNDGYHLTYRRIPSARPVSSGSITLLVD